LAREPIAKYGPIRTTETEPGFILEPMLPLLRCGIAALNVIIFQDAPQLQMTKEDDYRQNAADTVDLARRAGTSTDKGRLLALAEKWLDLAERAHLATSRFAGSPAQQGAAAVDMPRKSQPEAD
jgi:hypothetical protein